MDAAMTFNWLDTHRAASVQSRYSQHAAVDRLTRDNARLIEENEQLRRRCAELASSAELWIRLYEAALARANEAADRPAGPANGA